MECVDKIQFHQSRDSFTFGFIKKNRTIYLTRVGADEDRIVTYWIAGTLWYVSL